MLGTWEASGKCILLGEHFVVHGAPALAVPLSGVSTRVTVEVHSETGSRLETDLCGEEERLAQRVLTAAIQRLELPEDPPWCVRVNSSIPVGFGLGSSAAYATALVGALSRAEGREPTRPAIREAAHELEKIVHGQPSGIDDTVIALGKPIQYRRGQPVQALEISPSIHLVLASCGYAGSTRDAVAGVQALRQRSPAVFADLLRAAHSLSEEGKAALVTGDRALLGSVLSRNHALLQQIGVSNPDLDRLVDTATEAGAAGAKLTGAGCGGFVLALVDPGSQPKVVEAWQQMGAKHVFCDRIGGDA